MYDFWATLRAQIELVIMSGQHGSAIFQSNSAQGCRHGVGFNNDWNLPGEYDGQEQGKIADSFCRELMMDCRLQPT